MTGAAVPATMAGLVFSSDATPGLRRARAGGEFVYTHDDGTPVDDADILQRIASLAIPPAYTDVWICADARGHLQATGRDARGRKQYRYHPQWRVVRDREKFDRMIPFGRALGALRRRVRKDMTQTGLPKDKVVAIAISLLDSTCVRIGNESYVRANRSYGLTTLRNRHVKFKGADRATFSFRGKSGVDHEFCVTDRQIVRYIKRCQQLPGQLLFQYVDDAGACHAVTSDMVNEYLQQVCGSEFSAKDFRTWGATVHALRLLAATPLPDPHSDRASTACINDAIRAVASSLGNTPAICRKSYINPHVFDAWRTGELQSERNRALGRNSRRAETTALRLLESCVRRAAALLRQQTRGGRTGQRERKRGGGEAMYRRSSPVAAVPLQ